MLGRLFLALGMVQLWFTSQQQCGEAAWSCAHIVELVMLSQQPARGDGCGPTPDKRCISRDQLISADPTAARGFRERGI